SVARIVPAFTPINNTSPDGSPIMGMFDFFDVHGARHSGVFTQTGMFLFNPDPSVPTGWQEIIPGPSTGPPLPPGQPFTGGPFNFFQTAVVGYKLFFSQGIDPIQVWDGLSVFRFMADLWPIPAPPGFTPTHVRPVPAKYLMELDFHLVVGNTREFPTSFT